jgi:hypothetical protein
VLKDSFHNFIFRIDKIFIFSIFNSRILTKLSLPKGGEGWRKTLKILLTRYELAIRKISAFMNLHSLKTIF